MASRVKEDEKNERIIRGLLKLPENRRCINCNSLGPQYVCTNFWTFVCTTCGGIHREFTHRVKSVSLAKFTSQEVAALQEGGNKRARDIYFKDWDPQRQSAPDGSNVDRLRDFIKHIYVDRRYSGEKNYSKPSSMKTGEREDSYENRRTDTYQAGSRSPPSEDSYERHYSERSSPGGRGDDRNNRYGYDERRSPGYDQEGRQYNDYRRSPSHPEVINDWRREDRFGNGKKVEDRVTADGDTKLEGRSPERLKDPQASSPPIVRPVREILGDNVVPLRISEPPKVNVRTASSSGLGSTNGNTVEVKLEPAGSLIDFDDPEPPVATTVPQAQQTTVPVSAAPIPTTIKDNNWASFDNAPQVKVSQAPSNVNSLESVLSQLSFPVSIAGQTSGIPSNSGAPGATIGVSNVAALPTIGASPVVPPGNSMLLLNTHPPAAAPVSSLSTSHPSGVSVIAPGLVPTTPANGGNLFVRVNETGQWPGVQHQQPALFPASINQSTAQHAARLDGASGNQPWNLPLAPNVHGSVQSMGAPQVISKPGAGVISTGASQPLAVEDKSNGRKELPADLFTTTYSSFPAPIPVWQTGLPYGMGFAVQYRNAAVPMSTVHQRPKSTNPFDANESQPAQAQTFLSMAPLDGALPNVSSSSGLQHASSLGTPSPAWVSSQLPYRTALPSHSPHYASAMPPGAYMMPQVPSSIPLSGPQAMGGLGHSVSAFGARSMDQQMSGRLSTPAAQQPFSSAGGNPFG